MPLEDLTAVRLNCYYPEIVVNRMLAEAFKQLPFFEGLSPAHFACLQKLFYLFEYSEGTYLFEQGDPAEFLYLVVKGEVVVNF